ncbi:helix-turn-helix transcriptional regulator [Flavobacterium sp. SM2513]|uniref:helix-turn-helix transcriptional regulator n=1 Tax=Flavobacterium sp. SM2513 TaxID=3424766 RepID=UPI003D7FF673
MKLNNLKKVFDNHKVKNRVIAKYVGKSESTISLWRNNKRQPSLEEFYQIAKLLRVNIHVLIEPTNWKDEASETYSEFAMKIADKKRN